MGLPLAAGALSMPHTLVNSGIMSEVQWALCRLTDPSHEHPCSSGPRQRELHGFGLAVRSLCCCPCLSSRSIRVRAHAAALTGAACSQSSRYPMFQRWDMALCRYFSCRLGACLHTAAFHQPA